MCILSKTITVEPSPLSTLEPCRMVFLLSVSSAWGRVRRQRDEPSCPSVLRSRTHRCFRRRQTSSARRPQLRDRSAAAGAARRRRLVPSRSRPRTTLPDSAVASPPLRQRYRSRRCHPPRQAALVRSAARPLRGCASSAARAITHKRLGSSYRACLSCTAHADMSGPRTTLQGHRASFQEAGGLLKLD